MKNGNVVGAVCALVALSGATAQAAMLIDSFDTFQNLQLGPGGGNPLTGTDAVATGADAIGGARVIELTRTTGALALATRVNIENGIFGFGAEPGVGGSVRVWYDGNTDLDLDPEGLGGLDITEGGGNASIKFSYRYDLPLTILVTVYTDADNFSTASFTFSETPGFAGPFHDVLLPFFSFVPTGSGADFTNVGAISFYAETTGDTLGADFQLGDITAVPEIPAPGAVALLLTGAGLLAGRRRR